MKYIAYGSNMVAEQMAFRCPDAKLIGTGWLEQHTLEFYLHATVEPSASPSDRVPVAIWEISPADERSLDRYEGYPTYYTKEACTVTLADGSPLEGTAYIMNLIRNAPPTDRYYQGIANAYTKLGFANQIRPILEAALHRSLQRTQKD